MNIGHIDNSYNSEHRITLDAAQDMLVEKASDIKTVTDIVEKPKDGYNAAYWSQMQKLSRKPVISTTYYKSLRNSNVAFAERMSSINHATKSIYGTLYYADASKKAIEYLDALIAAQKRGVEVTVAVDSMAERVARVKYSKKEWNVIMRKFDELENAGGEVAWYGGMKVHLKRVLAGIHYKSLIIDQELAFFSGRNVSTHYFETGNWTDFGAKIKGQLVAEIGKEAIELMRHCRPYRTHGLVKRKPVIADYQKKLDTIEKEIKEKYAALPYKPVHPNTPHFVMVDWAPIYDGNPNAITESLILSAKHAKKSITFSTNFLGASEALKTELCNAAKRGVDVRIISNGKEASKETSSIAYYGTESLYKEYLDAGCAIYETKKHEHGKMYVFDGKVAAFGSYNASKVSDQRNAEALLFSKNHQVIQNVSQALESSIAHCTRYSDNTQQGGIKSLFVSMRRAVLRFFLKNF